MLCEEAVALRGCDLVSGCVSGISAQAQGRVMGYRTSLFLQKEWCTEMSVTIPKDRWGENGGSSQGSFSKPIARILHMV